MSKSLLNFNTGYILYITADKRKKTAVGLANEMNNFKIDISKKFSRLVYFEKFYDKNKALSKKRYLEKKDNDKIKKLISINNPDWLDLIFTLPDIHIYQKLNDSL